jgi:hypothetical protein
MPKPLSHEITIFWIRCHMFPLIGWTRWILTFQDLRPLTILISTFLKWLSSWWSCVTCPSEINSLYHFATSHFVSPHDSSLWLLHSVSKINDNLSPHVLPMINGWDWPCDYKTLSDAILRVTLWSWSSDGRWYDHLDGSLSLKDDIAHSLHLSPYHTSLSVSLELMATVLVNEYLVDWPRAQEGKKINDRGKEREVIDHRENIKY